MSHRDNHAPSYHGPPAPPIPPPSNPSRSAPNTRHNTDRRPTQHNTPFDLLRHCATGPPLTEAQVIALSDVVGSLRELVLLVRAIVDGDKGCEERLVGALGVDRASDVVAFWGEEWEVE